MRAHPAAASARWTLTAVFAADGLIFASWSSRIPQIQTAVHAGDSGLGGAMLGTAVGALIAMPLTGWVCRHRRPRIVVLYALAALTVAVLLPGLATAPTALFATLVVFGGAYGAVDVSMNASAVDIATALDRPILPSFHAAFSFGALAGAGGGSLAAAAALPVEPHLAIVATLGALCLALVIRPLARRDDSESSARRSPRATRPVPWHRAGPVILTAAVLTFGSAFGEGTTATWAAVHLMRDAHSAAALAPLGFALFSLAQAAGRTVGSRATERFGNRGVVGVGAALAAVGLGLAALPLTSTALPGYLLAGLGLSCVFPIGIALAGRYAGSAGVSVASLFGYGGFLLGPPLIGAIAGATSLGLALAIPCALALLVLTITPLVRLGTNHGDDDG